MQFLNIALLPVVGLMAAGASAAECYSQHGAKTCLNDGDLITARSDYCNGDAWKSSGENTYYGNNGWRGTITGSNIPTQQLCWDSTLDIINQCLGHKNGGSYSQNGWSVNIDFCA